MPCGFHGDSVDFDSVAAAESEFCAGDWVLPSPVSQQQQQQQQQSSLHNLDMVGFQADQSRRSAAVDMEDSSLVTEELKNRLLGKYDGGDECGKMETDDDFDVAKRSSKNGERKQQQQPEAEEEEEEEELFFQPPRRISMLWNSKLRMKEERKKVLKISINKLRRIEDPEVFLCRSVLINNTVRRLHREIREEKMARYPDVHRPVPVNSCSLVAGNIPEAYPCRKRLSSSSLSSSSSSFSSSSTPSSNALLDCKENAMAASSTALASCYSNKENLQEDIAGEDMDGIPPGAKRMRTTASTDYSGQTTVEGAAAVQRHGATTASPGGACAVFATNERIKAKCDQSPGGDCCQNREDKMLTESALLQQQQHAAKDRSRGLLVSEYEKQYSQYSCGHLSIFGELQSVVFHSLIASLES